MTDQGLDQKPALDVIKPEVKPEAPRMVAKIEITLFEKGLVDLQAPMGDRILCYGMLEIAQEMIAENHRKNGKILLPPGVQ